MSSRTQMKQQLARQQNATKRPYPEYEDGLLTCPNRLTHTDLWKNFTERFTAAHGYALNGVAALTAFLQAQDVQHGYIDPTLESLLAPHIPPTQTYCTTYEKSRVDEIAFGITRAQGAVAEAGIIILSDEAPTSRLSALTPQIHIAVIQRTSIYSTVYEAIEALSPTPYTVWVTAPSKTADVEGVLVEGVHGPGIQACLLLEDES